MSPGLATASSGLALGAPGSRPMSPGLATRTPREARRARAGADAYRTRHDGPDVSAAFSSLDRAGDGSTGALLSVPPEPVDLRRRVAAELAEHGGDSTSFLQEGEAVVSYLFKEWEPRLSAVGIGYESYQDIVAEYCREMWLWTQGERTWDQSVSGLAGRLARRADKDAAEAIISENSSGDGARPRLNGSRRLSHLDELESQAVFIMREVAAECERPALLFSGGKDSAVLLRLAEKAFRPGRFPFPIVHVDTGHNFPEVIAFRDRRIAELGEELIVASVQATIDAGKVTDPGPGVSRNRIQSVTLLDTIAEHGFDAAIGGARRDEDKARAKERVLSFRDALGQWDPRNQRPELWQLYQGRVRPGEHLRAFPLSDWTELDVWTYIAREGIELPSIYFAHRREVVERSGMLLAVSEWVRPLDGEVVSVETVRFRTVGDATCTGAVRSSASNVEEVIAEVATSRVTERGATRADDKFSETSMEDRKREGYF
jgi:sulfate adenylyltransferase subunit 2